MDLFTISSSTTSSSFRPLLVRDSTIKTSIKNLRHHKRRAATKIVKDFHVQFLATMIHEVRNPLTNINLAAEMLDSVIKSDDLNIYLDIIRRSTARINVLVCDLLKSQQPDEDQVQKHSIYQMLDEVLEMAGDRIKLKKIAVWKDYAEKDCEMEFNRPKMLIGLTNIIVNAIDAMTAGKGILKISTRAAEGKYIIQVDDNGCGISKENLKKIFNPYFTNKPGGLGLGLAATYDILQSNHVSVNVESDEGRGTRFVLSLDRRHQYSACTRQEINWEVPFS